MKNRLTFLLGSGAALLLGSCHDAPEPTATLFDTRWTLEQVDDTPVSVSSNSEEYNSFINFKRNDLTISGGAACNQFTGTFSLPAGAQRLSISQEGITFIYCGKTPLADRYLGVLSQVTRYEVEGRTLRLYDAPAGSPRLLFKAAP